MVGSVVCAVALTPTCAVVVVVIGARRRLPILLPLKTTSWFIAASVAHGFIKNVMCLASSPCLLVTLYVAIAHNPPPSFEELGVLVEARVGVEFNEPLQWVVAKVQVVVGVQVNRSLQCKLSPWSVTVAPMLIMLVMVIKT